MEWIINKIISKISPKKLARMVWKVVKPKLLVYVNSTSNEFDNEALEILDSIITGLIEENV